MKYSLPIILGAVVVIGGIATWRFMPVVEVPMETDILVGIVEEGELPYQSKQLRVGNEVMPLGELGSYFMDESLMSELLNDPTCELLQDHDRYAGPLWLGEETYCEVAGLVNGRVAFILVGHSDAFESASKLKAGVLLVGEGAKFYETGEDVLDARSLSIMEDASVVHEPGEFGSESWTAFNEEYMRLTSEYLSGSSEELTKVKTNAQTLAQQLLRKAN